MIQTVNPEKFAINVHMLYIPRLQKPFDSFAWETDWNLSYYTVRSIFSHISTGNQLGVTCYVSNDKYTLKQNALQCNRIAANQNTFDV